jgi:glucuronate isomerase
MSLALEQTIFVELDRLTLVDPHTHINPHAPAAKSLADILGYHYYTELAHSAGMPKTDIESSELSDRERVENLSKYLPRLSNTAQYDWLIEMANELFEFPCEHLDASNTLDLFDQVARLSEAADWPQQVLNKSNLRALFLTNDFDDPLLGFDTSIYIPCLRTDDLVFHFHTDRVQQRLKSATNESLQDLASLKGAIGKLFSHFASHDARACAISLPPDFSPHSVSDARAATALSAILKQREEADPSHRTALSHFIFWTLAQHCAEFRLPFDLMIGVNRNVYREGVYQGRDLFDSRVSLIQYQQLFNAFPQVQFPISVLASVTNQELVSYAWIFPNVIAHGHWWYSNIPSIIERDLAARLQAIPRTKQIGYYSDMYKLEFALPKFRMFKRCLARLLARDFVIDRRWSETQAVELGSQILVRNVIETFFPA